MTYKIRYKRKWFWKSIVVAGHRYIEAMDRMDFYKEDGGLVSIAEWSKYDMVLGIDWVLATKDLMEQESGQDIKLRTIK